MARAFVFESQGKKSLANKPFSECRAGSNDRLVLARCRQELRNPHDGLTLGPVIADLEMLTGVVVGRIHGDKGYRGHNYPDRFKVWISGQARRVTQVIRCEMRRRAAVEPVIGHLKDDHRRAAKATASTRFSLPLVITSACSCDGSGAYCCPVADPCSCHLGARSA
jgi:hypothetical protein